MYNCLCGVRSVLMCLCAWYIGKKCKAFIGRCPAFCGLLFCPFRSILLFNVGKPLYPHGNFLAQAITMACPLFLLQGTSHTIPDTNFARALFWYNFLWFLCQTVFSALPFPAKALYILCKCSAADFVGRFWNLWASRPCEQNVLHGMPFKYVVFQSSVYIGLLAHFSALL